MANSSHLLPLLRGLMTRSRDGMVIIRQETQRILSVNSAMAGMCGRQSSDLVGIAVVESGLWVDDGWWVAAQEELAHLDGFGPIRVDVRAGSGRFPAEVSGYRLALGADELVVLLHRALVPTGSEVSGIEVTDAFFALTSDALVLVDADGRIQRMSAAAERLYGFDAEELVDTRFSTLEDGASYVSAPEIDRRSMAWAIHRDRWGNRVPVRVISFELGAGSDFSGSLLRVVPDDPDAEVPAWTSSRLTPGPLPRRHLSVVAESAT